MWKTIAPDSKKIPAVPKDYEENTPVGAEGFEPPTLCL